MQIPDISVITTFYNASATLAECIESVKSQCEVSIEHLLVDDGSSDGSSDIASFYSGASIRHLSPGRVGRANALNFGLQHARAPIVAILDADDIALPKRFHAQFQFLRDNQGISLLAGNAQLVNKNGEKFNETNIGLTHEMLCEKLLTLNPFPHSTIAMRRSMALAIGGYNVRCEKSIDFNLYLALLAQGAKLAALAQPVIALRIYPDSWGKSDQSALQMRYGILGLINYRCIQLNYEPLFGLAESDWEEMMSRFNRWFDMRGYMRRHIAVKTLRDGVTNIVDGNYVMGLEQVTRAIKSDPRTLINRGVGFVYPRDADRFLKTFISRGHL